MNHTVIISVICPDRKGLVAAITGCLFDLGANLGDTTFAVLGAGAEFTSVFELPDDVSPETAENDLRRLPELDGAEMTVKPFALAPLHQATGQYTHTITLKGGDRPGLIARICEVFVQFNANIVRLNSERPPAGGEDSYIINIAVWIPEGAAQSCLSAIINCTGELGLACQWVET